MAWNKSYFNTKKVKHKNKLYDSKFEAGFGMELEQKLKRKEIAGFDIHFRIPLVVNDYVVCDYYIDFVVYHLDGLTEYIETKGYSTPQWKLKWKLFCALYEDKPNTKISLVIQGKSWKPRMRHNR